MDFSGCMSWWNLGAGAYKMNLWFSTLGQRTSKCAGGAHWSIDVEMLYLTGRLCLFFYHSTGSVWKVVAWDGMLRGLHHTLRLTCFSTFFSSMGYCILFVHGLSKLCAWLNRCGATTLSVSTVLLLLLFSWKTVKQNEIWLSRESLFRYD